jgi:hypothetical protein
MPSAILSIRCEQLLHPLVPVPMEPEVVDNQLAMRPAFPPSLEARLHGPFSAVWH